MQTRTAFTLVLFALALAIPSCGGGDEKPRKGEAASKGEQQPPSTQDQEEKTWQSMVSLMERLADIAEANRGDCDAMALKIDEALNANKRTLKHARSVRKVSSDDRRLQEEFQPRVMAAMEKLLEPMKDCKDNPALKQAIQKLEQ